MSEPKATVLIVDDEEGIHRALERTLRREPYELLHAYDAGEAEAILEQRPDLDAVICDHCMPGTQGLEFMIHLRRKRPDLVAILLTAQADLDMVLTAMNEGQLHRFFTKPWDGAEVRTALRKLLRLPVVDEASGRASASTVGDRLRRSMAPRQDDTGVWEIDAPAGGDDTK
jgi:DNA-binding NtrC family response regulator